MRAKQANRAADCPMQTISRLFMMPQRRKQPGSGAWRIPDQDESRRFFFRLNRQWKRKENGWLHVLKKGARTAWDRVMGHAVLPQKNPAPGRLAPGGGFSRMACAPGGTRPQSLPPGRWPKAFASGSHPWSVLPGRNPTIMASKGAACSWQSCPVSGWRSCNTVPEQYRTANGHGRYTIRDIADDEVLEKAKAMLRRQ